MDAPDREPDDPRLALGRMSTGLAELRFGAQAGEGLTVSVDGFGRIVGLQVPAAMAGRVTGAELGRLVVTAVTDARRRARVVAQDRLRAAQPDGLRPDQLDWPDWLGLSDPADPVGADGIIGPGGILLPAEDGPEAR